MDVGETIGDAVGDVVDGVRDIAEDVLDGIFDCGDAIVYGLCSTVGTGVAGVIGYITGLFSNAKKIKVGQYTEEQKIALNKRINENLKTNNVNYIDTGILKRVYGDTKKVRDYDGIVIDQEGRTVKVDGKPIDLSLREYELLKYLLDNENIALSRDKILNNVWNYDYYGDSRTIDSHIKKIRHKLGKKGKYIETVRGIGYKFEIKK